MVFEFFLTDAAYQSALCTFELHAKIKYLIKRPKRYYNSIRA